MCRRTPIYEESRVAAGSVCGCEKQLRSINTGKKTPVTGLSLTVRSPNLNHVGLGSGSVGMYRVRPVKRHRPGGAGTQGQGHTVVHGSHGQTSQHVTSIPHNQPDPQTRTRTTARREARLLSSFVQRGTAWYTRRFCIVSANYSICTTYFSSLNQNSAKG